MQEIRRKKETENSQNRTDRSINSVKIVAFEKDNTHVPT